MFCFPLPDHHLPNNDNSAAEHENEGREAMASTPPV